MNLYVNFSFWVGIVTRVKTKVKLLERQSDSSAVINRLISDENACVRFDIHTDHPGIHRVLSA